MSNCPSCEKKIQSIEMETIKGIIGIQSYNLVSYNCPHCHVSLGVQMDPIALKTDIVNQIKHR